MKKWTFILLAFAVMVSMYFGMLFFDLHQSKNRKDVIYSPDKSKSVSFYADSGQTHLMLNFHKLIQGGSGLGNFPTDSASLSINWIDNNLVEIGYPKEIQIPPKEKVFQFFKDSVLVRLVEN